MVFLLFILSEHFPVYVMDVRQIYALKVHACIVKYDSV